MLLTNLILGHNDPKSRLPYLSQTVPIDATVLHGWALARSEGPTRAHKRDRPLIRIEPEHEDIGRYSHQGGSCVSGMHPMLHSLLLQGL